MSGVIVRRTVKLPSTINEYNKSYLKTKMDRSGHNFTMEFKEQEKVDYDRN
jgi:GTP cyclohydrolase II